MLIAPSTLGKTVKTTLTCVTLALAATVACPTFAANQPLTTARNHAEAVVKNQARLVQIRAAHAASVNAVESTTMAPRVANSYRAYPPSCATDPLPDTPTGDTYSTTMPLYTRDDSGNPVRRRTSPLRCGVCRAAAAVSCSRTTSTAARTASS